MTKPKEDRTVNIPDTLFSKLLTDSELRMVKQRFLIINMLEDGFTIREIANQVGVGTDTVVRTARLAEKRGLKSEIKKQTGKSKLPWVFGKSD